MRFNSQLFITFVYGRSREYLPNELYTSVLKITSRGATAESGGGREIIYPRQRTARSVCATTEYSYAARRRARSGVMFAAQPGRIENNGGDVSAYSSNC